MKSTKSASMILWVAVVAALAVLGSSGANTETPPEKQPSNSRAVPSPSIRTQPRVQTPVVVQQTEPPVATPAKGATIYVEKAEITSVVPKLLGSGEPFMVTVDVTLATPLSQDELLPELDVYVDALKAEPAAASASGTEQAAASVTQSAADPASASRDAGTSRVTTRGPFGLSLFVVAPAGLAPDREVTVSVFSKLDRRQIASAGALTAAAEPEISGTGFTRWLPWIGAGVVLLAAGMLLVRSTRASRYRIDALQAAVQSERSRAAALVRGESAHASAQQAITAAPRPPELPRELLAAMGKRDVVVVLGSGASAQAGLPTSASLWLNIFDRHESRMPADRRDLLRGQIAGSKSASAIELLNSTLGREVIVASLQEEIGGRAEPSHFHRLLAGLPLHAVIDTTWDAVAPTAFAGRGVQVFSPADSAGLSEAMRSGRMVLLKPQGDIRNPSTIALTELEQRRALAQAPEMERALAALFSGRTLLFLGMGLQGLEYFLKMLPPQLESQGQLRHFAILPEAPDLTLWQQGLGKRYGVQLVDYVPGSEHQEVVQALERLAQSASQGSADQVASREMMVSDSRISHLHLRNIGIFKELKLEFAPGWTLLLGNNGGGKSTILRAVGLALAGNDARAHGAARRLLRSGTAEGTIELGIGNNRILTKLVRDNTTILVHSPQTTALQAGQVLVLGFPALRGHSRQTVRGPTKRAAANPSVDDLAPLLEGGVDDRLDDLKQWVVNTALRVEADPSGREARMFTTFQRLINEMVPGGGLQYSHVDRETWQVILKAQTSDVPFDGVSQGMSSILNWVGLLLQRLYEVYPRSESPEREPAVVLVDEIDAHLHPEWQRRLVALTKEHFPNVQVIASSHSPLLAGAVAREELRVVAPNPQTGEVEARTPSQDVSGQKAEDILVSSLFALQTTRSIEAERAIERYFKLFGKDSVDSTEQAELDELHVKLQSLNYGATLEQRQQIEQMRSQIDSSLQVVSMDTAEALKRRFGGTSEPEQSR